ncbi:MULTISPECIES: DUF4395 domain-containing protein [Protofrankia]|uniref:DUF4395 domain-containing protein n=1 Tax=Candidatus Protofrankia datiscae TaxID=2716812 RepID=F8AW38_9ACTN|nr:MULTISPECIES: DUF4395 domain-containing protein [Protofrankia]AEH11360.1 hypothetical protein FsymDg_4089 [Candidatus Protofrankia datiscae]
MVDPRGPRFSAAVTSVVLTVVLLTANGWLLLAQTVVFLTGAVIGVRRAPYGVLYRTLVQPRLGPPAELEDDQPPRFAQAVGAVFGVLGTVGFLADVPALGYVATAFAFVAAFLNATIGFCLGCQIYLAIRSVKGAQA